jgi:RNA polymerase sigma factor (sigma-70 family)
LDAHWAQQIPIAEIFAALIRLQRQMSKALLVNEVLREQDRQIAEAVKREGAKLKNFIRARVPDERDAEDILQEVFYELVEAYRMMKPIGQVGAWLFRVARNRITDLFRKRRPESLTRGGVGIDENGESLSLEDLLPSADAGPEAAYARSVLVEELAAALDELPQEQRRAFMAHEIEGQSFEELARVSGANVNTLIVRKHRAVIYLRERLEAIYRAFQTKT